MNLILTVMVDNPSLWEGNKTRQAREKLYKEIVFHYWGKVKLGQERQTSISIGCALFTEIFTHFTAFNGKTNVTK